MKIVTIDSENKLDSFEDFVIIKTYVYQSYILVYFLYTKPYGVKVFILLLFVYANQTALNKVYVLFG